jgi:hypothetical protein
MNRRYHRCIASEHLVHYATIEVNLTPSDEPTVPFLVASDELEKRSREAAASDELTVHWRELSVYPVVVFEQDRDAPRRSLKHRMNRRVSSGSSDGRVKANKDDLAARSSTPDEPTVHRSIASE